MKEIKLKRLSLAALLGGYLLAACFIFLVFFGMKDRDEVLITKQEVVEINNTIVEEKIVYVDREVFVPREVIHEPGVVYKDKLTGVVLNDDTVHTVVKGQGPDFFIHEDDDLVVYDNDRVFGVSETITNGGRNEHRIRNGSDIGTSHNRTDVVGRVHDVDNDVDLGILDRRLREREGKRDLFEEYTTKDRLNEKIGIDKDDGIDFDKLTVADEKGEGELGDIALDFDDANDGYGTGKGGQLYAYNFPSQGVGAGVGSSAIGAGAGGGAGLSAGIGEGMLNGEIVPTLGGIGDGAKTAFGEPAEPAGVGGLVGGAGAGGAAGLTQGYITEKLGMGIGAGPGSGGGLGAGRGYNYDHLPENGSLHIMIHVDGSGSILSTRKELDIMKDTLLKDALLPYYNNNEDLYNKRVTILDDSGERTLQFFTQAAKQDNVLAIAFQDEAAPDYHLPNFNKVPQGAYTYDLKRLKFLLSEHRGLYRGIMFQVDRGRTFSKSFKELIECAWNGEGYLSKENLKKYHRDENLSDIKNKRGIVFSDEYHAKSEGDPQYYMNLIFDAAKRVGIDLNIQGAGLTDGKKVKSGI